MNKNSPSAASGPFSGLRVIEFAGIGPGPFACMLLSDMGAEVIRIERPEAASGDQTDIIGRGRHIVKLDLKKADDRTQVLALLAKADVLVEGFRPEVMERLLLLDLKMERLYRHLI